MRVLIVDDESGRRRLLQLWVEGEGATAVEAASSEQAMALVAAHGAPAVALCDINLPGKNGLWLTDQLRTLYPETAVVITTGVHAFDAAVSGLQSGVIDYLVKPFTRERVLEALGRAALVHRSRREVAEMQGELDRRRTQISEAIAQLEVNGHSSLEAMLSMLRGRDPAAYDHVYRVAPLAVNLAMALRIGEPQLSDIERAALLHELGRVAMPDTLLQRPPRALSADEHDQLRSYPLHGYAILKNVPFLAAASELALSVHERYDGSGFPQRLQGSAIPLGARIITVAKTFDELVSGLAGEPLAPARALDILDGERAAEFDPLVVGALRILQGTVAECRRRKT
jgi:response regulator RpfG family c-di-GMP phosphodiesterase